MNQNNYIVLKENQMTMQSSFTPIIKDHRLYQSNLYLNLISKFKNEKLKKYLETDEFSKLFLSIIEESNIIKDEKYLNYLEEELVYLSKNYPLFERIFLLYEELAYFYKIQNKIFNLGRGASCNSLSLFALGITQVDPVDFDLNIKRFSMDIDLNVESRESAIDFLKKKYKNNMALLEVEHNYTIKGAFNEVMSNLIPVKKLYDYTAIIEDLLTQDPLAQIKNQLNLILNLNAFSDFKEVKEIQSLLLKLDKEKISDNKSVDFFKIITEYNSDLKLLFNIFPQAKEDILNKINTCQKVSIHIGAVMLSDHIQRFSHSHSHLDKKYDLPIIKSHYLKEGNVDQTLLKMDILEVKVLKEIQEKIDKNNIKTTDLPYNKAFNQEYWKKLVHSPSTFQYSNNIITKVQKLLNSKINSITDFIQLTSLSRPFFFENKDIYINKKYHDQFSDILKNTNGILIFQEDLIKIGEYLKIKDIQHFYDAFTKRRDIEFYKKTLTEDQFDFLYRFGKYTYSKGHAIAFAYMTFFQINL